VTLCVPTFTLTFFPLNQPGDDVVLSEEFRTRMELEDLIGRLAAGATTSIDRTTEGCAWCLKDGDQPLNIWD
jgi:hypothetical protein